MTGFALCWPLRCAHVPVPQIFYASTLLQEPNWSNGRWEGVEMENAITSSFCQEIRNAISGSSPWQTAGSWALLLLPGRSGGSFVQPPAPLGRCLEAQSCKFFSLLETCVLVLWSSFYPCGKVVLVWVCTLKSAILSQ